MHSKLKDWRAFRAADQHPLGLKALAAEINQAGIKAAK
jgi:hypothetical protein